MKIEEIGAIVTGGGSGLGESTVRELAGRGAKVAIFDLPNSRGAEIADELGDAVHSFPVDVTDTQSLTAGVDGARESMGSIHALINCAGVGSASRTVDKDGTPFDLDHFRRTIEINLIGTFNAIRLVASTMISNEPNTEGERGCIVNTSSVAAFEGQIGQAAYSASKGGIVGLTLPVARDLSRHGVRCCSIAPGLFATPLLAGLPAEAVDALGASIPFPPRLGKPAEYAALACHILENPMLNGETVRLDGAIRMQPR
ncbi:3-hydroxyacyl-CoA dehydrogenase [Myxococcota bacterium]|nr:3-hydroxyacyl-CoA dehydrogenase [Myxococcota bacterium]